MQNSIVFIKTYFSLMNKNSQFVRFAWHIESYHENWKIATINKFAFLREKQNELLTYPKQTKWLTWSLLFQS